MKLTQFCFFTWVLLRNYVKGESKGLGVCWPQPDSLLTFSATRGTELSMQSRILMHARSQILHAQHMHVCSVHVLRLEANQWGLSSPSQTVVCKQTIILKCFHFFCSLAHT